MQGDKNVLVALTDKCVSDLPNTALALHSDDIEFIHKKAFDIYTPRGYIIFVCCLSQGEYEQASVSKMLRDGRRRREVS